MRAFLLFALVFVSGPSSPPSELRDRIDSMARASGAEVAVAMRTLDGQKSLLISEKTRFHAASTMKVPVMIELFAQVKAGRLSLDDQVVVSNRFHSIVDGSPYEMDIGEDSDPVMYDSIGKGVSLSLLCDRMIVVSSNLATNILIEKLGVENIRRTVQALGGQGMEVLRGVEDIKAFRKGLSNSTDALGLLHLFEKIGKLEAIDIASSRRMIEILKRQEFGDGIPAGLPEGVPVAHKTGEITRIHHDAGIVYGARPFVLVVLVRGIEDRTSSATLIAEITRAVYEEVQ